MRPRLLALALLALVAAQPLAGAAETIYDRLIEVSVGRPHRDLIMHDLDSPSMVFVDILCHERATAQVTILGVGEPAIAGCLPNESASIFFPLEAGPVALLVTGQSPAPFQRPGLFRAIVEAEAQLG